MARRVHERVRMCMDVCVYVCSVCARALSICMSMRAYASDGKKQVFGCLLMVRAMHAEFTRVGMDASV